MVGNVRLLKKLMSDHIKSNPRVHEKWKLRRSCLFQ